MIEMIQHAFWRGVLHFVSSGSLLMMSFFFFDWLRRRKKFRIREFLPQNIGGVLTMAALFVFACSTLREPLDVHNGQPIRKAPTDFFSWLLGLGIHAWAVYRLIVMRWEGQPSA